MSKAKAPKRSKYVADYTIAAEKRRQKSQARENLFAAHFGRAPRNFLHVGPHPMGCEESLTEAIESFDSPQDAGEEQR